jgi:hypothetical protein
MNEKLNCSIQCFISRKGKSQHEINKKHLKIVNENKKRQSPLHI